MAPKNTDSLHSKPLPSRRDFFQSITAATALTAVDRVAVASPSPRSNQPALHGTPDHRLPFDPLGLTDARVFEFLKHGDTTDMLMVGNAGFKSLLCEMDASCIDDLVAATVLFRPSQQSTGRTTMYCEIRRGHRPQPIVHPVIDSVLRSSNGMLLFDDQVVECIQAATGLSPATCTAWRLVLIKGGEKRIHREFQRHAGKRHAATTVKIIWRFLSENACFAYDRRTATLYGFLLYQAAWFRLAFPEQPPSTPWILRKLIGR